MGLLQVSTGSIASANLGQKSLDSTPAFLQNTGAVMMTDSDMNHIRGENWILVRAGGKYFVFWFRVGQVIGHYVLN